jgi:hypothetical protein
MISGRRGIRALIRGGAKPLALAGIALIFVAQLIAVAHFHQRNTIRQFNAQTQVVTDDGLCALCLLACHTPLNPAATPAIAATYAEIRLVEVAVASPHVSNAFALCRTRAPPAAIV